MVAPTGNSDPRRWWQRKRWWIVAMILITAGVLVVASILDRTQAIERLRIEMRDRALNGPEPETVPPCVVVKNTGEVLCDKRPPLTPCRVKVFIDPFDIWAGVHGQDALKAFTTRKFHELGDMEQLTQWFACQGFNVWHKDGRMHAYVRTEDGYGPFSAHKVLMPFAWGESASIGLHGGKLRMDIGTTYQ